MIKTSRRQDFIPRCGVKCVAIGISMMFKLCGGDGELDLRFVNGFEGSWVNGLGHS